MPLSRSRDYLSIGEVLDAIREEFPDVSVSKIRFLEAEGLITPERTGSGYRKFYDADLKRLRYILGLQRDQFLPLRVIRERLATFDANGGEPPAPQPAGKSQAAAPPAPATAATVSLASDVSMSRAELLKASGLSEQQLKGLEEFGILPSRGEERYNGDDLTAAKAARALFDFGIEPRHLRMYRQFADREASFVAQIISPAAARRDKDAQKEAARSAGMLLDHSRRLRDALVRSEMREVL
jgi:DNA-binding transcriptional MerR regulator